VLATLAFTTYDDGRDDRNYGFGLLHERIQLGSRDDSGLREKAEPLKTFSPLLLSDAELMDEVRPTLGGLGFLNVSSDGACRPEVLLAQDPAGAIFPPLQELIESNGT